MDSVSVVIPTWNRANSLVRAVQSALAQAVAVTEVLVCDDGSEDDSQHIISTLSDPRVRLLAGQRSGQPAVPRNRGISVASGTWIAFLDSDDAWLPRKLEMQLAAVRAQGALACSTNAWRVVPNHGRESRYLDIDRHMISLVDLVRTNYVICSSVIVHRTLLEKVGRFPEDKALTGVEDYALWLRIAAVTDFAYVPEPLVDYTDSPTDSIRAMSNAECDREAVSVNFLDWTRRIQLPTYKRKLARSLARRAIMKNKGQPAVSRILRACAVR